MSYISLAESLFNNSNECLSAAECAQFPAARATQICPHQMSRESMPPTYAALLCKIPLADRERRIGARLCPSSYIRRRRTTAHLESKPVWAQASPYTATIYNNAPRVISHQNIAVGAGKGHQILHVFTSTCQTEQMCVALIFWIHCEIEC